LKGIMASRHTISPF